MSKGTTTNVVENIITALSKLNVQIFTEGENLSINAPKGVIDDELKLLIRANKDGLMKYIKQTRKSDFFEINPLPVQSDYLLSSSQYWFWALSQIEEVNIAYNMMGVFEFSGSLNFTSLEYAFQRLIERHEILRTTFKENKQNEVRQFIHAAEEVKFRVSFLDLQLEDNKETKIKNLIDSNFKQPFDLVLGPLLRVNLYQLETNRWVFSFMMHHIITDAWSMEILINEVLLLYNSHNKRETVNLLPLRIQYKDYAYWQQMQLANGFYDKHKTFWLKQLDGVLPVLQLSTDQPRTNFKTYNGGKINRTIEPTLSNQLNDLVQKQACTLFMGLVAVVNILLHKYTDQEDIILGTPVSGRDSIDLEGQIGLYLNALPLRTQFKKENSFKELLDNIKMVTLNAYEHQMYPFHMLVDSLNIHKDMSRNPLYDVLIIMTNAEINNDIKNDSSNDLKIKPFEGQEHKVSKLDLTFSFVEMNGDLHFGIEYNTDLFYEETIVKICNDIEQLMKSVIIQPSLPIHQIDYLSIEDKLKEIKKFNDANPGFPDNKMIAELIERKAINIPNDIAFTYDFVDITFNEINEKANRLNNYLKNKSTKNKNNLIGIRLEDKIWLLIAILAILKAEGTYLLIDPKGSKEYLDFVLKDSNCNLVINKNEINCFLKDQMNYDNKNVRSTAELGSTAFVTYIERNKERPEKLIVNNNSLINHLAWKPDADPEKEDELSFDLLTECPEILLGKLYNQVISYNRNYLLSNVSIEKSFGHFISDDF